MLEPNIQPGTFLYLPSTLLRDRNPSTQVVLVRAFKIPAATGASLDFPNSAPFVSLCIRALVDYTGIQIVNRCWQITGSRTQTRREVLMCTQPSSLLLQTSPLGSSQFAPCLDLQRMGYSLGGLSTAL